jgi:hypothetical protein
MIGKFIKQWTKKQEQQGERSNWMQMALTFYRLTALPSEEAFLSDKKLADVLLDFSVESNFSLFYQHCNMNPDL